MRIAPVRGQSSSTRARGLTVLAVCGLLAAGCGGSSAQPDVQDQEPAYSTAVPPISPEAIAARGTIVSAAADTRFDPVDFPAGATAATFVYNSVSGVDGAQTEVSGALFVPGVAPPTGGYPVVAYAHGTVGIGPGCAPSENATLSGDAAIVSSFLRLGYAVTFTDYQGLSSRIDSPAHPYLEPRTAATNVIDSVRAARGLDSSLSSRWVAVGTSQGGHAAWAATELNEMYGDGLDLLGAAVLSPALDISPVVESAQDSELSAGQRSLYPLIVEGAASVDPGIVPSEHLHGVLGENAEALASCGTASAAARLEADADVQLGDTTASTSTAAEQLTQRLQDYALPRAPTTTPILAVYGGDDDIVRPAWTEAALARACGLGDTVLKVRLEGQGHTLDPGPPLGTWIADRFASAPAPSNC